MYKQFNLEKLSYYSLFLAVLFLPIKTSLSNFWILLLLILSLGSFFLKKAEYKILKNPLFYLGTTIALFIPILIGSLYAPIVQKAYFQLGKCIFYLLLPILILRTDLSKDKIMYWCTIGLIIGSVCSMVFLVYLNAHHFINSNLPIHKLLSYNYTGHSFVRPLKGMHPLYLGSYYLFMLVLMWRSNYPLKKSIKWIITLITLITLILLNTRSVFFIGILLLLIHTFTHYSIKKNLTIIGLVLLLILFLQPFLKDTYVYNKLIKGTQWELTYNVEKKNTDSDTTADSRMSRWIVSMDLIKGKPIFGHGTGSARLLLINEFKERNMQASLEEGYDSHNQYLGYGIEFGLLGVIFLLLYFFINFYTSIRTNDLTLISFVLIVSGLCLTENYLIRNMGINFVALFGTILFIKNNKDE